MPWAAPKWKQSARPVTHGIIKGLLDILQSRERPSSRCLLGLACHRTELREGLVEKPNGSALGASGSKRGDADWEITFRFAASPNRTNFQVGPITVAAKKGWEYLWVRYADAEDATVKVLVKRPVAAYVEKVYPDGSFAALGIGA